MLVVDGWQRHSSKGKNDNANNSYLLKNINQVTTLDDGVDKENESNYSTVEFLKKDKNKLRKTNL